MKFFAKDSTNVSEAFIDMTKEIIKNSNKKGPVNPKKENVVVSNAPTGKSLNSKGGCC